MKRSAITILSFCVILFVGCKADEVTTPQNNGNDSKPDDTTSPVSNEGADDLGEANEAFGLDLFKQLNKDEPADKNIIISPVSIQTALNMVVNGARGTTQQELLEVMRSQNWDLPNLNEKQRNWRHMLANKNSHPTLKEANALFMDPNRLDTKEAFEDKLQTYYNADKQSLSFDNPTAAKDQINNWVDNQTNGKIEEIIKNINSNDLAFLINTLYFQSDWQHPFAPEQTTDQTFTYSDESEKQIPFMNRDSVHSFHTTSDYVALDKPFKDNTYSFTLIKPENDVQTFIEQIDPEWLNSLYDNMKQERAIVNMPKMKLAFNENLNKSLKNIGIQQIFDKGEADLSGMGQSLLGGIVFISRVRHGSVLEVDEKGIEGAAVTSVGVSATSAPPVLTFDEPFVLILRHKETNSILFIGRVMKPNWN